MQEVNKSTEIAINGENFCFFEDIDGKIISITPVSKVTTIPDNAIAFTYAHQKDEYNKFLRTYRIGTRLKKSVFDFELMKEANKAKDYSLVTYNYNSDFCMFTTPEKKYFYSINDTDVVVNNKEELNEVFIEALASKGAYTKKI